MHITILCEFVDTIELLCDLLTRDNVGSINISNLGHTLSKNVFLNLRALIMSPQCVHLRGGCVLILKTLEKIESYLQLGRLSLEAVVSVNDIVAVALPSLAPAGSGGRAVPNSEVEFRKALGSSAQIKNAILLLRDLEGMCRSLKFVSAKDVHMNSRYDLEQIFEKFPGLTIRVSEHVRPKAKASNVSANVALEFDSWMSSFIGGKYYFCVLLKKIQYIFIFPYM